MPYEPYSMRPHLKRRNSLGVKLAWLLVIFLAIASGLGYAALAMALS